MEESDKHVSSAVGELIKVNVLQQTHFRLQQVSTYKTT
jgi:hypothetical protein